MVRTVWVGLVFLAVICGLMIYKIGAATPAKDQAASADPAIAIVDAQIAGAQDAPFARTDRLDVNLEDVPNKTLVHTIPIVLSEPAAKAEPEKARPEKVTRIISRHWRASYARIARRSVRRHREASRPAPEVKSDAKSGHTGLLGWLKGGG